MSLPSFSSLHPSPSQSFVSSHSFPSDSVSGLHLIGSFLAFQVDHIVAAQAAKRRGGPKRAVLAFELHDERSVGEKGKLGSVELSWKTIAGKAFSNRDNIKQYTRSPFAAQICAEADGERCVVVVHGAKGGKGGNVFSNTVGVNVSGKQLQQHPRFLLSSGKGESGARSTFLVYHSNRHARVCISALWIEHRELKVVLEQAGEEDCNEAAPIVSFAKQFKPVYHQRQEEPEVEAPKPKMNGRRALTKASSVTELQQRQRENFRPFAASSSSSAAAAAASSSVSPPVPIKRGRSLSALPPPSMPPALMERVMRRKRSLDDAYPAAAAAACSSASSSHTLDSPPHIPHEVDPDLHLPEGEEPASKREKLEPGFGEQWMAANALNFSGFDSFDSFDQFGSFFQSPVELVVEDSMADLTEAQLDSFQADGDCTPHSLASDDETPRMATTPPPFLHQAQDGEDAAEDAHMLASDDADAQPSEFAGLLDEADAQLQRFQPPSPFSSALSKPMHTESDLPLPLKTAHLLTANPFRFEVFGASPQISPSFGAMDLSPSLEPIKSFSLGEPCSATASPQASLLLPPSSAFSPPPALFDEAALNCSRQKQHDTSAPRPEPAPAQQQAAAN